MVVAPPLLNCCRVTGILGKLSFDWHEAIARPILEQIIGIFRCGRPGATALQQAPGIALGWCGTTGNLPARQAVATNQFQTVRVVADAVLANSGALRMQLERRGCRVRTTADAEVIAHADDAWGERCVKRTAVLYSGGTASAALLSALPATAATRAVTGVFDEWDGGEGGARLERARQLGHEPVLDRVSLWFRHYIDGHAAEEPLVACAPLRAA